MTQGYQPFLISEFKTGINTYLEPWQRPADAFEPLVNAYVNRGTVNKRAGYSQFGNQLADHNPVMGLMSYLNESTGAYTLLAATTVHLYLYNPGPETFTNIVLPANFTGTIINFFNYTNWQATSGAASIIYMTNNKDPVTLYDGTSATQPALYTDSGHTTTITTCLDLKVYKERLLYIRPTLSSSSIPQNQAIYWSAQFNPTNVVTDVAGNGGFLEAPTGDIIQAAEFLRDVLVVFFTNSTWIFRFTGNQSNPFRWDKVNDSKSTNCPYASIDYDERCTSIGAKGLIACDGVNVQRYDIPIIDYYETNFSEQYYAQAFGQRYDNLNQGWMLYVSSENTFPLVGSIAPGSDQALIYNFVENTFATYEWSIPLTCLGTFYAQEGETWEELTQSWESTDFPWFSYGTQKTAPILLAGDTSGNVWHMDDQTQQTDNGTPILPDIVTTRWNPIMQQGQKVQFGWIDIYYSKASTDPLNPIVVNLDFYVDNSETRAATRTLTLDGPVNSEFAFKRIYMNLIGEFFQMEIDATTPSMVNSSMKFIGFIIWAKPAGRLTP
jgi:hypothetical protein